MQSLTSLRGWLLTLFASIALVALLAGSAAASEGFVYALNQINGGANQIYGYRLDPTSGALTLLPGFPIASGGTGRALTLSEHVDCRNIEVLIMNNLFDFLIR